MTTQRQVTSVTTKHWSDYVATTFGPACARTARSSPNSASCALATNPLAIVLTACCSLCRSRGAHVTLSVWTLSSIYPRLTVSPLSWWLLTVCPSNVFSFQLRTLVLPRTLQMHSSPMCPQSMAPLSMCPPTADWDSPLLGSLLRMRLHFTSCHHPSANGQVERFNTTLEQYLRFYCNYEQDN